MDKKIHDLLCLNRALTANEEQEVFLYYAQNHTTELRNLIVEKNMGLVRKSLGIYKHFNVPTEDLEQEGVFGLITAIDHFDCTKGFKFSTYAFPWIHQVIQRYIHNQARMIRLPVYLNEHYRKINKVRRLYLDKYGIEPSREYIAEETGMELSKVSDIMDYFFLNSCASINQTVNSESDATTELGDLLMDDNTSESMFHIEQHEDMQSLLSTISLILSNREYLILDMRYGFTSGEPMTLSEIGEQMGCTRERIRQIEKKAIQTLQRPSNMKKLSCYREYIAN